LDDGSWPEDSVNGRVDGRLRELAEIACKYGNHAGGSGEPPVATSAPPEEP
jgi:hypothetical protein